MGTTRTLSETDLRHVRKAAQTLTTGQMSTIGTPCALHQTVGRIRYDILDVRLVPPPAPREPDPTP